MTLYVIGLNHKTAGVSLREKVYFPVEQLALYLQDILNQGIAYQAVLLSTCNRSELYCDAQAVEPLRKWFLGQTTLTHEELHQALYVHTEADAVAHLMQVACGLDSMILGESQILGQMKQAFSESCAASAIGASFHRLFQEVFNVAKEIRTTTAIGACPVSVASATVYFAKQHYANLENANVVMIGAGETTELLLRYLSPLLKRRATIVNRSVEHAKALQALYGGQVYGLDQLEEALHNADLVISATGALRPILTKESMAPILLRRLQRPLLLIDIAVPRDICPSVSELLPVQLFCIDDLKHIIEKHKQGREHAALKAFDLINRKSIECITELNSLDNVAYTIRAYRSQIESLCAVELLKARHQLIRGESPEKVLEQFAAAYTKKLLHAPSVSLRQAGVEGRFELLQFAKQLFALPDMEAESL